MSEGYRIFLKEWIPMPKELCILLKNHAADMTREHSKKREIDDQVIANISGHTAPLWERIFIPMLYGLFSSKKLPPPTTTTEYIPEHSEFDEKGYEYSFKMPPQDVKLLLNCLLGLYLKIKPFSTKLDNDEKKEFYDFFKALLSENTKYLGKVVIPFYLDQANTKEVLTDSFLQQFVHTKSFQRKHEDKNNEIHITTSSTIQEKEQLESGNPIESIVNNFITKQQQFNKYIKL